MGEGRFINVRKLAAMDLHFRGSKFILLEFGFVVFVFGGLGSFSLLSSNHATLVRAIGLYLVILAVDYLPLLTYGVVIARAGSAKAEAEPEISDPRIYKMKYGLQQALLLVPFVIPALAVSQEIGKESKRAAAMPP